MRERQFDVRRPLALGCYLLIGFYLLTGLYLLSGITKPGWFYQSGVPMGADFLQIWAGSSLAANGHPAAVYDVAALKKAETAIVGGDFPGDLPWHYPPSFLLMMLPISAINYPAALAAWLFLPLLALLIVLYRIFPDRLTIGLALAFPGTALNLFFGQGAILIAFLMGSGLLLLESSPLLAGIIFSLIINYKPHLGLLILVALVAGRNWRALGALVAASAALILVSSWVLGLETWLAFWNNLHLVRRQVETGAGLWDRMPTIFAAVRLLGGGNWLAQSIQLLAVFGVTAIIFWVWRRQASLPIRGAVLLLGTLLVTPHALNYDLALLLLPLAWVAQEGFNSHWTPGTKIILGITWISPFLNMLAVEIAKIHVEPIILAALLIFLLTQFAPAVPGSKPAPSG